MRTLIASVYLLHLLLQFRNNGTFRGLMMYSTTVRCIKSDFDSEIRFKLNILAQALYSLESRNCYE